MNRSLSLFIILIFVSTLGAQDKTVNPGVNKSFENPKVKKIDPSTICDAKRDANGVLVHAVRSPYQAGNTKIRVLLPERIQEGCRSAVVYVLPVEAGDGSRYGDGLIEIKKHGLHNKYGAIFVAPTFSHLPWYADHPTNQKIRQETYFVNVVVPFVEKTYSTLPQPEGCLLLGFSKSGWGAWSLLLRHPGTFGRAAAWDSPLMMEQLGKYGAPGIFETQRQFERYRITDLLKAKKLQKNNRLILTGYGGFRRHHQKVHALMLSLKIPHEYRDGPARKHDWHSGWVSEAVELLLAGHRSVE